MAERHLTIRSATPADTHDMAEVDRLSWPAPLASSEAQLAARVAAYPEGQLVAVYDGRIVGVATAQRITEAHLAASGHSFGAITDNGYCTKSHTPDGEIYQLIGVGVLPEMRGHQLGRLLIDRQIDNARLLSGVRRILGFTRPSRYHRYRDMPIGQYVGHTRSDGRLVDPVLAFHVCAGARIVAIREAFRPQDHDGSGYGILIEYPVQPVPQT